MWFQVWGRCIFLSCPGLDALFILSWITGIFFLCLTDQVFSHLCSMSTSLHQICDASSREWIDCISSCLINCIFSWRHALKMPAVAACFSRSGVSHTWSSALALCLASRGLSKFLPEVSGQLHGKRFTSHATFLGRRVDRIDWKRLCTKCMAFMIPVASQGFIV